jgi:hypothetical protein
VYQVAVVHVVGTLNETVRSNQSGANVSISLDDARKQWDIAIRDEGDHCPCCGKWGKVYKVGISHAMMKALLWMASNHGQEWIDMPRQAPRWLIQTYTFATLKWWRLIERMPLDFGFEDGQEKKFSGYWRVTPIGMQFAKGLVQVPKNVYLYDNSLMDVSTETIYIKDCVGKKFNYSEIMNETWGGGY